MRRIACIAKPATLRTRSKTSIGWCRRAVAGPITRTCKPICVRESGVRVITMAELVKTRWSGSFRSRRLSLVIATSLGIAPAIAASPPAAPPGAQQHPSAAGPEHLFGEYLAGRHAQQSRDFRAAAGSYQQAIGADPDAPELISRT